VPCRPPDNGWSAAQFSIVNGQRAFHQDPVQLQFDFGAFWVVNASALETAPFVGLLY
ncbi:uncharacterized protein METZ01_LOCUS21860, partial [marine metagenome]